jgi:hypothetical protein
VDKVETIFSFDAFQEFYETLERNTSWKYHGGTDVIGLMIKLHDGRLQFDYSNSLVVNIDKIDSNGKFDFSRYIVDLIDSARAANEKPLEEIGRRNALDFIVSIVRHALPQQIRAMLDSALKCNLRRDITRPA